MSSRGQRPQVGGVSAEVVSIGIGGTHHPDYGRIVCGQLAAARRQLGMDLPEFARLVNDLTNRDAIPATLAAWESDMIPPADVLRAAEDAARISPAAGSGPALITTPPSFSAEVLAGHWVTSYQFTHADQLHHHADIARVAAESASRVRAVNHPPTPRTEGRSSPFRNEIVADLANRHLNGQWKNVSDSRYWGLVELAAQPGETVMDGYYTGYASDILVSMARWRWVRLDPASIPEIGLAAVVLRDPAAIYELVMNYSLHDEPLTLADVTEEN